MGKEIKEDKVEAQINYEGEELENFEKKIDELKDTLKKLKKIRKSKEKIKKLEREKVCLLNEMSQIEHSKKKH